MPDLAPYAAFAAPSASQPTGADQLMAYDWPLPPERALRGVALLVHGLGEHAGRYTHVADFLSQQGFAMRGYDHYGHGRSPGKRGDIRHALHLLDGLDAMVAAVKADFGTRAPLLLLGHSMGGLVAARWLAQHQHDAPAPVQGLVLSSPALGLRTSMAQKALLHTVPYVLPHLCVGNGLSVEAISRNAATVQAYRDDPLVHDRISGLLGRFLLRESAATQAAAPTWRVPTLLMHGGGDRLVDPAFSRQFVAHTPAGVVQAHEWPGYYHEIFNEPEAERTAVLAMLGAWLQRHF